MQGMKLTDMKITDHITRHKNAGREIVGMKMQDMKMTDITEQNITLTQK